MSNRMKYFRIVDEEWEVCDLKLPSLLTTQSLEPKPPVGTQHVLERSCSFFLVRREIEIYAVWLFFFLSSDLTEFVLTP